MPSVKTEFLGVHWDARGAPPDVEEEGKRRIQDSARFVYNVKMCFKKETERRKRTDEKSLGFGFDLGFAL